MLDMESICFEVISNVGSAKSSYIEAIACAREGQFTQAQDKITEGDKFFQAGHTAHKNLLTSEASGEQVVFSMLLLHAEDQLMAAETAKIYAQEFIKLYKALAKK